MSKSYREFVTSLESDASERVAPFQDNWWLMIQAGISSISAGRLMDIVKRRVFYAKDLSPKPVVECMEYPACPSVDDVRRFHGAMGIQTEVSELIEAMMEHQQGGSELDRDNFIEELGDIRFYLELAADAAGVTMEEVEAVNVAKLTARYGGKFDSDKAYNRDIEGEKAAMESARVEG